MNSPADSLLGIFSTLGILNTLLTAEKVEATLYTAGLQSGVLAGIDPDDLTYFQAATPAEFVHAQILESLGACIPSNQFFFPADTFTNRTAFLNLVETLETAGVGAYAAAVEHFSRELRQPDLALLASRILGVEAEHRTLARAANKKLPPDDVILEAVPTLSFPRIASGLLPFLVPNQFGGTSTGPIPFPDQATVLQVAGRNLPRIT